MDFPTEGEVTIDGQATSKLNDGALTRLRREKVGFIFQSFQLLHTLSVLENVEMPLLLAGKEGARATAREQLQWVELTHYGDRMIHQLSGGEQQRVAIARALVHRPRLLLADEPTGNLDSSTGELILQLLRRAADETGVAILMATHSAEGAAVADRVIRLRDGAIENAPA
jgi:ABC-type lipoprotein export system ATPase subunit